MLTAQENALLTQVGPGTHMGQALRQFWIPALQADELAADGAPVRAELLGQSFVAFRDSRGEVGLLNELCPHRGASLVLGRNEDSGLRCIYHGWKFDRAGTCLDMPTEPRDTDFHTRVHARSYPVREAGGLIWAYLGEGDPPPLPNFLWMQLPEAQRRPCKVLQHCNYLQSLEGGIDSAHVSFLHRSLGGTSTPWGIAAATDLTMHDTAPRLEVQFTNFGFRYAALRNVGEDQTYVRITPFVLPWYTYVPGKVAKDWLFHAWVPRDDHSTWSWDVYFNPDVPVDAEADREFRGLHVNERFEKPGSRANNWLQDRAMMRAESFSGIRGILNQDEAVQESMGAVYDRTQEHLGTSDKAVIAMRRLMLDLAKAGSPEAIPGVERGADVANVRSVTGTMRPDQAWREEFPANQPAAAWT